MANKIVGAKATGQNLLVELLTTNEVMQTTLTLGEKTKVDVPQAYIIDIGPSVDKEKVGVNVGDRIILSGGFVPLPKALDSDRQKGIIDCWSVKAVLKEESSLLV